MQALWEGRGTQDKYPRYRYRWRTLVNTGCRALGLGQKLLWGRHRRPRWQLVDQITQEPPLLADIVIIQEGTTAPQAPSFEAI